ncbi:MAG TPA: Gmad2 immunoglobulin-like domain-containing protein [Ferruginibacter sp.]|nr:Gmad2 immunoglobulin-like domain-containing protein [Ferruginibacter sp.]
MRSIILLSVIIIVGACNASEEKSTTTAIDTLATTSKKSVIEKDEEPKSILPPLKIYSNKRFKDVIVERIGRDSFRVRGQGQIFEANFNWIIEDGHEELKKGFQMTDAGAPEWGKFDFIIHAPKKRAQSTLTLILFESSAKDGSRQHELPIMLY